jgi:hypothetical protein
MGIHVVIYPTMSVDKFCETVTGSMADYDKSENTHVHYGMLTRTDKVRPQLVDNNINRLGISGIASACVTDR